MDFSQEFFPQREKPRLLKGAIDADLIKDLEAGHPAIAGAVLASQDIGHELKEHIKSGEIDGMRVLFGPEILPHKYYNWDKMWLARTPDGVPVGISLNGSFIKGSDWFRIQLERIMHGMKPEEEPCKIFVLDPGLLRKSKFVECIPFYRIPEKKKGSPSHS